MHNGYLMVEGQKMSKSLGNVVLVHDLVGRVPGEAIRFALLSAQYRQPFDWTEDLLQQSKRTLDRYYGLLRDAKDIKAAEMDAPQGFAAALQDDLNTPKAFAELAVLARNLSTAKNAAEKAAAKGAFLAAGKVIGLLQQDPEVWFKGAASAENSVIEQKIVELQAARSIKDYKKADAIRHDLHQGGVSVSITPAGITWRKES
jgi:cysteinyl-tRNA synthetase